MHRAIIHFYRSSRRSTTCVAHRFRDEDNANYFRSKIPPFIGKRPFLLSSTRTTRPIASVTMASLQKLSSFFAPVIHVAFLFIRMFIPLPIEHFQTMQTKSTRWWRRREAPFAKTFAKEKLWSDHPFLVVNTQLSIGMLAWSRRCGLDAIRKTRVERIQNVDRHATKCNKHTDSFCRQQLCDVGVIESIASAGAAVQPSNIPSLLKRQQWHVTQERLIPIIDALSYTSFPSKQYDGIRCFHIITDMHFIREI